MNRDPFRSLRELLFERRARLALAILLAACAQLCGIPLALLVRRLVNAAAAGDPDGLERLLWTSGLLLAALALLQGLCRFGQGIVGEQLAQETIAELRVRMLAHLQLLPASYFERRPTGKILVRFVGDAAGLRNWIGRTLVVTPADVLTILGVAAALAWIQWQLLAAALVPLLLVPPAVLLAAPRIRAWTRDARREQSRVTGEITDELERVSSGRPAHDAVERIAPRIRGIAQRFVRRSRWERASLAAAATAGSLSVCSIGVWGALLVARGAVDLGDVMAAVWLTLLLRGPVRRLSSANRSHQRARVSAERIEALLTRRTAAEARV